jgi:replication factor C subunit 3/5
VQKVKVEKGLALPDIIREVHLYVLRAKGLPDELRLPLVIRLAELENNLACGANERLQLTGLIAAFQTARADISR